MAMVDADWTITRSTGAIRYIGADHGVDTAATYATVIEFHRWLQDFADDAEFGSDDELDIIDNTPSDRSTDNIITLINGFNIDADASEHLYDGSIIQDGGDTIYDGIVNFGNVGVVIQLLQDGGKLADDFWNFNVGGDDTTSTAAAFMTDTGKSFTTDEFVGYVIENITDGSRALITANTATTVTGTLYGGTGDNWDSGDTYLISQGLNSDATSGISHRFMVPTRLDGVDVDRRKLIGTNRTYERTYGEFSINQTARGNNVLALTDADDLNNNTAWATVDGWAAITNTEGLRLIDINGDTTDEEYYSEWNRDVFTINQFYERLKQQSADASVITLQGIDAEEFRGNTHSLAWDADAGAAPATNDQWVYGELLIFDALASGPFVVGEAIHGPGATPAWKGRILGGEVVAATGTMVVDLESGTLTDDDTFTGQTSGATANLNDATEPTTPTAVAGEFLILAVDDDAGSGNLYGQVLKGNAPANNVNIYDNLDVTQFVTPSDTVVERTISTPFVGVSTGSALIGSYGLGMEAADTSASDLFFDLSNTAINPPNNVTFTVDGLVSGEDYILVGTDATSDFDFDQYTLNGALTGGAVTAVVVNGSIDSETPSTGTIRITRADGLISRHPFSDATASTFTITSHDFSTNNAANGANVFTSFMDVLASGTSESFSYVYNSDRTVFIRVRDGGTAGDNEGTKTFEGTGTVGSAGGTVTAIRTSDV